MKRITRVPLNDILLTWTALSHKNPLSVVYHKRSTFIVTRKGQKIKKKSGDEIQLEIECKRFLGF